MSNQYAVENGWLVELVNEHTCGTAAGGYYGAHEPGCGMIPLARVEDLIARFDTVAERLRDALSIEWENGNLETGAFDRLEAIIDAALGEA